MIVGAAPKRALRGMRSVFICALLSPHDTLSADQYRCNSIQRPTRTMFVVAMMMVLCGLLAACQTTSATTRRGAGEDPVAYARGMEKFGLQQVCIYSICLSLRTTQRTRRLATCVSVSFGTSRIDVGWSPRVVPFITTTLLVTDPFPIIGQDVVHSFCDIQYSTCVMIIFGFLGHDLSRKVLVTHVRPCPVK